MNNIFQTIELSDPAYEHDGLRFATVKSPALNQRADVSLWVPQVNRIDTLLILLHGVYGSHWVWPLKGGAHLTAQRMVQSGEIAPMVIAMPSDGLARDGSAYLSWPSRNSTDDTSFDVERWILDEVPAIARIAAPALQPGAAVAIAGLSMGGYGALRLGSKYAHRFCAISAHSAITEIEEITGFVEELLDDYLACASRDDLSPLYWMRTNRHQLSPLRFDCGVDDPLIHKNRALSKALSADGIPHEFTEFRGGHSWDYWKEHFVETLRFVDKHSRNKGN